MDDVMNGTVSRTKDIKPPSELRRWKTSTRIHVQEFSLKMMHVNSVYLWPNTRGSRTKGRTLYLTSIEAIVAMIDRVQDWYLPVPNLHKSSGLNHRRAAKERFCAGRWMPSEVVSCSLFWRHVPSIIWQACAASQMPISGMLFADYDTYLAAGLTEKDKVRKKTSLTFRVYRGVMRRSVWNSLH